MDPELIKAALNWGFPALLIFYAIWFFQTQAWPKFIAHLDKIGEMIDGFTETKTKVTNIDNNVTDLMVRIPQRVEQDHR